MNKTKLRKLITSAYLNNLTRSKRVKYKFWLTASYLLCLKTPYRDQAKNSIIRRCYDIEYLEDLEAFPIYANPGDIFTTVGLTSKGAMIMVNKYFDYIDLKHKYTLLKAMQIEFENLDQLSRMDYLKCDELGMDYVDALIACDKVILNIGCPIPDRRIDKLRSYILQKCNKN